MPAHVLTIILKMIPKDFRAKCVTVSRASQDKGKVNTLDYQLIESCKSNSMIILNGRIGLDKGVGRTTSKDCSLVDYIISSPAMVSYFKRFEVLDFDPVYSDVHCGLSCEIESMLECNHLRPDKIESINDPEQCEFVTKWPR